LKCSKPEKVNRTPVTVRSSFAGALPAPFTAVYPHADVARFASFKYGAV
jgi:hypothetical protein